MAPRSARFLQLLTRKVLYSNIMAHSQPGIIVQTSSDQIIASTRLQHSGPP